MLRILIVAACIVIVIAGLRAAVFWTVPLLLATFLAILLAPAFLRLRDFGLPTWLALTVTVAGLALAGAAIVALLQASLTDFAARLPDYQQTLRVQIADLMQSIEDNGFVLPEELLAPFTDRQTAMSLLGQIARTLSGLLTQAFMVLIFTAFMLAEAAGLNRKLDLLPEVSQESRLALRRNLQKVRRYLALKTVMSLLTGALVVVMLWLMGVENALFMGLLAFLLNYIPNVGSFLAAIPGVLLAFIQFGPGMALVAAIGYFVLNTAVSNGIEPRVLGDNLGLSPLAIIVSLVVWGWVLGPIGMLLAVPITMMLKAVLEAGPSTRIFALFLGAADVSHPRKD
ncbi:AI-2E family transporter [Polymorphum gilvum]|uniref:Permease, PerM family n=1 Tax=Polymorphum gilvum (strain LMG 25793 / CGMCC 1.9160 / SL003B-26A1) TaxID=991905 RepID=F2IV54_POLGS|nr:AI-2E family transporter [Polymorphum gilvum]ADZ71385.1 Permease, PerM family [Polymorphum gilvum SL003B-26A1]